MRVLFDDRHLYFAIRCYDSEPDRIVARRMRRDDRLFEDDSIEIVLDTYNNRRGGYCFSTNSLGAQRDALLIDEGRANAEATWKPSERLSLEAEYEINRVELPTGHFTTHRTSQRMLLTLSTDLYVRGLVQWNSQREVVGGNLLLGYRYLPGSDLFLVYNHLWDTVGGTHQLDRSLQLKLSYFWRP